MTRRNRRWVTLALFLGPATIFLLAVVAYPLASAVGGSFFQRSLLGQQAGQFVGLGNYGELVSSDDFWTTLSRTVVWTVGSVSAKTVIGLTLALLLVRPFWGNGFYRVLLLIPWATPQVIGAVAWKWFYNGDIGYLNFMLMQVGLIDEQMSFLGSPTAALPAVMAVDIWFGIPFMTIMFLAGLQAIPADLYEAARVDGARGWHQLRYITLPLLLPVFMVATVLSFVWTFNSFNIIQTMTGGGPLDATKILVIEAYQAAFEDYNVGMASAYATLIFVILITLTLAYWRLLVRRGDVA